MTIEKILHDEVIVSVYRPSLSTRRKTEMIADHIGEKLTEGSFARTSDGPFGKASVSFNESDFADAFDWAMCRGMFP